MKVIPIIIAGLFTLTVIGCDSPGKDSVKLAHEQNLNSAIDEETSSFLTEAANTRMTLQEIGKLAVNKSVSPELRQYGQQLVDEQNQMLQQIRMMAAQKNINLPSTLSNRSARDVEKLGEKSGVEFEDDFLEILRAQYRNDVDAFDDATEVRDKDVKLFAESNLPVIESAFEETKALEERIKTSNTAEQPADQ